MEEKVMEKCPTGIEGFDSLCNGGFIRNSSNVIVGGPGSGKTTFMLQFLYYGITKKQENGLYCSFEPDIMDTIADAKSYGIDFYKLAEEGKIKFVRFSPETSIKELKSELTRMISKNDIKRLCIDPVSVLALNITEEGKVREKLFEIFSLMKRLKVTVVLADESMVGETKYRDGDLNNTDVIRFLCDSVTVLYLEGISKESKRSLRIEKMRRTNHSRDFKAMKIGEKGIEILN
jgi:circadian clock protein KaiC